MNNLATPTLEWRDYLTILIERIWIAITVFVAVVIFSLVHLFHQTPIYRSSARILVEDRPSSVSNLQDVLSLNRSSLETFNTHIKALSSRKMIEEALLAEGLNANPDFLPSNLPQESRVDVALGFLRIEPVPASRLIDVIVEHPNAEMAARFANVVAEEYIRQDLDIRLSKSLEVVEWLREQSDDYRIRLEEGLLQLQRYRKEQKAVSLEERQDVVISKLKDLNQSLTKAENNTRVLLSDWESVEAATNNVDVLIRLPVIASDQDVWTAYVALNDKENELGLLTNRYLHKHPKMQRVQDELAILSAAFRKACMEAVSRIEARYRSAVVTERNLRKALSDQEQEAFELDRKLVTYQQSKRSVDADREVYEGMLGRIREALLAGDMRIDFIRLVDPARISKTPARPSPKRIVINGVLLGLVLGIGLSFGFHAVDSRIRRVDEVEDYFGLPVLAAVPHISKGTEMERRRITEVEPHARPAEAFRTLRARLGLQSDGQKACSLLITSSTSSEGKSLVASNLAIVFAHDNEKTLLIDADMRRPTAHDAFDFPKDRSNQGLSQVLRGKVAWNEAVQMTSTENLDVMLAGEVPPNPAELLGSSKMVDFIREVEERYDRVILDSPPVMGVSDPLVMLSKVDGIVFVVHFGKTRRHAAKMALQQLGVGGTPLLGIVLDNVKVRRPGSYYYYYYHHFEKYETLPETRATSES